MNHTITVKEQLAAAFAITATKAEAIRELKSVPAGHLYAQVMGRMSLEAFEAAKMPKAEMEVV